MSSSADLPRDLRARPLVRQCSKRLFGSQYRLEVAGAISELPAPWTTRELEHALPGNDELPRSCIAKELNALIDLGLVERARSEPIGGRNPYQRTTWLPSFWALVADLRQQLDQQDHKVVRIRDSQ